MLGWLSMVTPKADAVQVVEMQRRKLAPLCCGATVAIRLSAQYRTIVLANV